MYVTTRKLDQTIVIGGNVIVSVQSFDGDVTNLGFVAPDDVTILCEELGPIEDRPHAPHKKVGGMLVLPRKVHEGVLIGRDITRDRVIIVKVLEKGVGRVRVGIDAPDDVKIDRGEFLDESRRHGSKERF